MRGIGQGAVLSLLWVKSGCDVDGAHVEAVIEAALLAGLLVARGGGGRLGVAVSGDHHTPPRMDKAGFRAKVRARPEF